MKQFASRFDCPSSWLELRSLRRRTSIWLGLALAAALAVHLSLTRIAGLQTDQKAAKPLTTTFVKRSPRLTKPLELKKRPRPKRRQLRRETVSVKARARHEGQPRFVQTADVVSNLARPRIPVGRPVSFEAGGVEPEALAEAIEGSKEAEDRIDMALEMVDIDALDTGRYHAMVVQDPTDKRNISGFFHFVRGYSSTMRHTDRPSEDECEERQVFALRRLADYINRCTDVKADVTGVNVPLDSDEILKVPWVYLGTKWPFQLTASELEHLGRYLVGGGFLFVEPMGYQPSPAEASFRDAFMEALAHVGVRGQAFERIPNSHPIYHCYFDFDGPPMGYSFQSFLGSTDYAYLEGLFLEKGRLVGIISRKWYANPWGDWGPDGFPGHGYEKFDPTRPLQFGVNLIIFALTQEGSITHRLMESVE